jgi:hypothetical protein
MIQVKAPRPFADLPHPWVFLAGSIEADRAARWQHDVVVLLAGLPGTILNPRRDDWDASWRQERDDPQFREQVEWELHAQEHADTILMYFAPETRSPVTLLELGLFARSGKLFVCCPPGFWRKGNVDVVCERYAVPTAQTLEGLVQKVSRLR